METKIPNNSEFSHVRDTFQFSVVEQLLGADICTPLKAPSHQASASTDGYVPQHFRRHATSMLSVHKPIIFTHRRHWQHYAGPTLR